MFDDDVSLILSKLWTKMPPNKNFLYLPQLFLRKATAKRFGCISCSSCEKMNKLRQTFSSWVQVILYLIAVFVNHLALEEMAVCCMGQQHPGRHRGQLKPWECLSNWNSRHFYYCIVQDYCLYIVIEIFLWEAGTHCCYFFDELIKIACRIFIHCCYVLLSNFARHLIFTCQQYCCWTA